MRYKLIFVALLLCGLTPNLAYGQASDVVCSNCVHASDLAAKAVTSGKLGNSAVVTDKIAAGAITTNKIGNASVSRSKLRAGSVSTGKLQDGAVTARKISPASVGAGLNVDGNTLRLADGFATATSACAVPMMSSTTETAVTFYDGRLGRFHNGGAGSSDILLAPISLPDGARIVSYTYTVYDGSTSHNSESALLNDQWNIIGDIAVSSGDSPNLQTITITGQNHVVDNTVYSYMVAMTIVGDASDNLAPINAVVGYVFD